MAEYYFDFFISIEDIKEFLCQQNIAWNGQVKSKSRDTHTMDEKDLYLLIREPLELNLNGQKAMLMWADGLSFNCSNLASKKDWRIFLLNKYGKTYADALQKYIEYEKRKLHKIYQDRLKYNINLITGMEKKNLVLIQSEIDVLIKTMKAKLSKEYKEELKNKFSFYETEIEKINNKNC